MFILKEDKIMNIFSNYSQYQPTLTIFAR